jgi:hypothetical protein
MIFRWTWIRIRGHSKVSSLASYIDPRCGRFGAVELGDRLSKQPIATSAIAQIIVLVVQIIYA